MRLLVTAGVLACASYVMAQNQTKVEGAVVQNSAAVTQRPATRPGLRKAGGAPGAVKTPEVSADTPVVTLDGLCKERQAKAPCKTVITRGDLDQYVNAFAGDIQGAARGRLAVQYARAVTFAMLAEQQGLDKNPSLAKVMETQLNLVRARILAGAYLQTIQQPAAKIADADIQKYYDKHHDQYEQAAVLRLSVPIAVPTVSGRPLDRAAVRAEMEEIRKRAAAGEDFGQLQLEAYRHLQIQATPPPMSGVTVRRNVVQGDELKAFDLKVGEISEVMDLPAAFALVKLLSKGFLPVESARSEIEAVLRRDRTQNEIGKITKKIIGQFNLEYLGLQTQPDLFGPSIVNPVIPTTVQRAAGNRQ